LGLVCRILLSLLVRYCCCLLRIIVISTLQERYCGLIFRLISGCIFLCSLRLGFSGLVCRILLILLVRCRCRLRIIVISSLQERCCGLILRLISGCIFRLISGRWLRVLLRLRGFVCCILFVFIITHMIRSFIVNITELDESFRFLLRFLFLLLGLTLLGLLLFLLLLLLLNSFGLSEFLQDLVLALLGMLLVLVRPCLIDTLVHGSFTSCHTLRLNWRRLASTHATRMHSLLLRGCQLHMTIHLLCHEGCCRRCRFTQSCLSNASKGQQSNHTHHGLKMRKKKILR